MEYVADGQLQLFADLSHLSHHIAQLGARNYAVYEIVRRGNRAERADRTFPSRPQCIPFGLRFSLTNLGGAVRCQNLAHRGCLLVHGGHDTVQFH